MNPQKDEFVKYFSVSQVRMWSSCCQEEWAETVWPGWVSGAELTALTSVTPGSLTTSPPLPTTISAPGSTSCSWQSLLMWSEDRTSMIYVPRLDQNKDLRPSDHPYTRSREYCSRPYSGNQPFWFRLIYILNMFVTKKQLWHGSKDLVLFTCWLVGCL